MNRIREFIGEDRITWYADHWLQIILVAMVLATIIWNLFKRWRHEEKDDTS